MGGGGYHQLSMGQVEMDLLKRICLEYVNGTERLALPGSSQ